LKSKVFNVFITSISTITGSVLDYRQEFSFLSIYSDILQNCHSSQICKQSAVEETTRKSSTHFASTS